MNCSACVFMFPLCCQGGRPTLLRVLGDNRVDGRHFVFCQTFSEEVFLHCYREAHQDVFGMLEVTSMVDFLMIRLRGALQEPWMSDVPTLRRFFIAGQVLFADLRGVVTEFIPIWTTIREYVRFTGPQHFKSSIDRVGFIVFVCMLIVWVGVFCIRMTKFFGVVITTVFLSSIYSLDSLYRCCSFLL